MEVEDYRSGIDSIMSFSCKSKFTAESTLFNASKANTNFRYRIIGNIDDDVMNIFNSLYNIVNKFNETTGTTEPVQEIAVADRIKFLKSKDCDIKFEKCCVETARRNLIQSGGLEMPLIVGEMLKYYFFIHNGEADYENISMAIRYLASTDPVEYGVEDIYGMYKTKVGNLLYNMFTGMRLGTIWSGRQSVTGGYICAKKDGDVVAFHANVADEFREFLINQLSFETSSAKRHEYMKIEKEEDQYFLNLNMQIRFAKSEIMKIEDRIDRAQKQRIKLVSNLDKKAATLEKRKTAKVPNPLTIAAAQEKYDEAYRLVVEKDNEIRNERNRLERLISGDGEF